MVAPNGASPAGAVSSSTVPKTPAWVPRWRTPLFIVLIVVSTVSQLLLLSGLLPWQAGQASAWWWSAAEMLLMLVLLSVAIQWWWRVRCLNNESSPSELSVSQRLLLVRISGLLALSLALASGGDLINKNLQQEAFAYDQWIQHSYLIDSIICFFPAYSLVLWAVLSVCQQRWQGCLRIGFVVTMFTLGSLVWWDSYDARMAWLPAVAIWMYSVLMLGLVLSAALLAYHWGWRRSWPVVLGLVLAVVADGLIGQFWLSTNSYYPQIRFVNWIVYFSSQVLIQCLPLSLLSTKRNI
jgi:hypothetical protein